MSTTNDAKKAINLPDLKYVKKYVDNNFYKKTDTVANATNAASADYAIDADMANFATDAAHAYYADNAENATNATNAAQATKATQDGDGKVIKDTYYKKTDTVARATEADRISPEIITHTLSDNAYMTSSLPLGIYHVIYDTDKDGDYFTGKQITFGTVFYCGLKYADGGFLKNEVNIRTFANDNASPNLDNFYKLKLYSTDLLVDLDKYPEGYKTVVRLAKHTRQSDGSYVTTEVRDGELYFFRIS